VETSEMVEHFNHLYELAHGKVGVTKFATHGSLVKFWPTFKKNVLSFIAKDKGAMHALGSIISPTGCETLMLVEAFHSCVLNEKTKWSCFASLDVARALRVPLAGHDGTGTWTKEGKHRTLDASYPLGVQQLQSRMLSMSVTSDERVGVISVSPAKKGVVYDGIMDLNYDAMIYIIPGATKVREALNKARAEGLDCLAHDHPDGKYIGPFATVTIGTGEKQRTVQGFTSFVLVFPVTMVNNKTMGSLADKYHMTFSLGPMSMNFSVIVCGELRKEREKQNMDLIGASIITALFTRLYLLNKMYIGVVRSPAEIARLQHRLANQSLVLSKFAASDKAELMLKCFQTEQSNKEMFVLGAVPMSIDADAYTSEAGASDSWMFDTPPPVKKLDTSPGGEKKK
jgi:hypothetical protein